MATPIPVNSDRLRIDFKAIHWERLPTGQIKLEPEFDERRYEWVDDPAEGKLLHDLSTGFYYPERVVMDMLRSMPELPAYRAPDVPDVEQYLAERRRSIAATLMNGAPDYDLTNPSSAFLEGLIGKSVGFAAVSVDLVGSTRLQATHPEAYNTIVPILLNEIALAADLFDGVVIKYVGDEAVIGFPEPGFCIAADMAFDAATCIGAVVHVALVPELKAAGLPPVQVRVGADANDGLVTAIGGATRREVDVLSLAISMAAKVQAAAPPGEIWIGQTLHEILHVSRQALLEPAVAPSAWQFVDRAGEPYKLYHLPVFRKFVTKNAAA